jgi:hypothetical protein
MEYRNYDGLYDVAETIIQQEPQHPDRTRNVSAKIENNLSKVFSTEQVEEHAPSA